jgi:hypothetical protein
MGMTLLVGSLDNHLAISTSLALGLCRRLMAARSIGSVSGGKVA